MFAITAKAEAPTEYKERFGHYSNYVVALQTPPQTLKTAPGRTIISWTANVALGYRIAQEKGLSETQWQCWYKLGMNESGWNHLAKNKYSGAYGIAQSLPATKYLTHGDMYDPEVQIRWMYDYSIGRYGSMCNAYYFQVANNWY